ncbi:MAG: hypothetical protein CR975_01875 [Gammaproteobacteria bacterium]|nr:MAG: hypothetical protein CR975_01875 [Gammaproteobacteria bacterium]
MADLKKLLMLIICCGLSVQVQAVNFGLITEMYQNGELSESEYNFKRFHQAPREALNPKEQLQRVEETKAYRGKANGMYFKYTETTLKDIDDLFDIDEEICDYDADKYFDRLKGISMQPGDTNTLTPKALKKMRFVRCMSDEGWQRVK